MSYPFTSRLLRMLSVLSSRPLFSVAVFTVGLLTVTLGSLTSLPALADQRDHDRARQALERGEILALADILPRIESRIDGRLIDVELDREDGRFVYELTWITRQGRIIESTVNAATGEIIHLEQDEASEQGSRNKEHRRKGERNHEPGIAPETRLERETGESQREQDHDDSELSRDQDEPEHD